MNCPDGASLTYVHTFCSSLLGGAGLEQCRAEVQSRCGIDVLSWFRQAPGESQAGRAAVERCVTAGFQQQPGWVEQLETVVREKEGGRSGRVNSYNTTGWCFQCSCLTARASIPALGWRWRRQAWLAGGTVVLFCLAGVAVQGWRYFILRQERAAREAELLHLLEELTARTHACDPECQVRVLCGFLMYALIG